LEELWKFVLVVLSFGFVLDRLGGLRYAVLVLVVYLVCVWLGSLGLDYRRWLYLLLLWFSAWVYRFVDVRLASWLVSVNCG